MTPDHMSTLLTLKLAVNLVSALADQEETAHDQDQVATRDLLTNDREPRRGEADHPGERDQQQDPGPHRHQQTQPAGTRLLRLGQLAGQDRDEDDVVDPQHDFECRKGRQRDPRLGGGEPFHGACRLD